ncbi:MAG: L-seryl-tRNA(Sec) selenium transferase, partial [Peptostreptococcaceae bacterium]
MIILEKNKLFAMLPSVDEVLGNEDIKLILSEYPRSLVLYCIRESINEIRKVILNLDDDKNNIIIDINEIIDNTIRKVKNEYSLSIKKVINGTGVVLHTNLGRSLLSDTIKEEVWQCASRYSNLEYNIESGERGSRYTHLVETIKKLTKAEDVLVVNNNAAAVLLVLSTLSKGNEVIVSRGELVEV